MSRQECLDGYCLVHFRGLDGKMVEVQASHSLSPPSSSFSSRSSSSFSSRSSSSSCCCCCCCYLQQKQSWSTFKSHQPGWFQTSY